MQGKKVVIGLFVVVGLGFGLANVVSWKIKDIIRELPKPVSSPDGAFVASLAVTESGKNPDAYLRLVVQIKDQNGQQVMLRQTKASAMRYYDLRWESADRLLLESAEKGELRWTRSAAGWEDDEKNAANIIMPTTQPAK